MPINGCVLKIVMLQLRGKKKNIYIYIYDMLAKVLAYHSLPEFGLK